MTRPVTSLRLALILIFLGVAGTVFAVTGLWAALPAPAAGGTCGPGRGSEAAVEALVNPASIGAGPEPAPGQVAAHAQWTRFVHECQTAADDRALATLPILILSIGLAVAGLLLVRSRGPAGRAETEAEPRAHEGLVGTDGPRWGSL